MYKIIICLFIRPFILLLLLLMLLLLWTQVETSECFYMNFRLFLRTRIPYFNNNGHVIKLLFYIGCLASLPPPKPSQIWRYYFQTRFLKLLQIDGWPHAHIHWLFSCILMNKINHTIFPNCFTKCYRDCLLRTIWINYK